MGMFSWDCKHCGHPLICEGAAEDNNKWMVEAVALLPNGSIIVGEYDGYGRIDETDIWSDAKEPQCYHKACWEHCGKPTEFKGPSPSSADQGWFFEDGVHNSSPPGTQGFFMIEEE